MCVVYSSGVHYISEGKNYSKRKIMGSGDVTPRVESWFSHLAAVTLDKAPSLLELHFSYQ